MAMAYSNVYLLARSETFDTVGVSRLGEEERSESFPSLVTKLMASIGSCFIILSFFYCPCSCLCKMGELLLFNVFFSCFFFKSWIAKR